MIRLPRFHLNVESDVFKATPRDVLVRLAERNGLKPRWWWPRFLIRKRLLERIGDAR